tara:strand:- start:637 stop:813 length:177 start_codon:yes stop_codon:yes gene_type:complete
LALEDDQKRNPCVAPLALQSIANAIDQLKENPYNYGQKQTKKRFRTPIKTISNPSAFI